MYIKNVIEYFEKAVELHPEKTAVIDADRSASFGELAVNAQSIAAVIGERFPSGACKPVVVYLEKSIECVAADIGVIYSANAYMNLDTKMPLQRARNVLELVKPLGIITDESHFEAAASIFPADGIVLVDDAIAAASPYSDYLRKRIELTIDTDPLCLINTSGSTGTPKSVALNHRSFIDFTEWALGTFDFSRDEVIGSLSPAIFDIFSFELCLLMARGATIAIIPSSLAAFPVKVLQLLRDVGASYIFWVPTIMVNIANLGLLDRIELPDLRTVWFAGEVFPTKQFNIWRKALPDASFTNLYGPIEITLDCTYYTIDREIADDEPLPIGIACRNTDILILDENNAIAAQGAEGEICVRGSSLALGYYNNPEKTAAAFVQNPLNNSYPELIYRTGDIGHVNERGEIIFRGRRDNLVKHSGYRIDLGEIEHVSVSSLQLVRNGCVVYDHPGKEIVLFYEADSELKSAKLRRALAEVLPKYMIPTRFVFLEEMPRNPNGKIDRLKLKEML